MELGEKILQARQAAKLSQRQLCGDVITRNMLSQIEHGTARPSMDTLRYLAARLKKPISYFLEEDAVLSPNQERMQMARQAQESADYGRLREILGEYHQPDPVFDWERSWLQMTAVLELARDALAQDKPGYAGQLLAEAEALTCYVPDLQRQRLLLQGKLPDADLPKIIHQLPSLDEELMLRAEAALAEENHLRALDLLSAVENKETPGWNFLQGKALLLKRDYVQAAVHLKAEEQRYPRQCIPLLEICFRELGDFRQAYEYACKRR